MNGTDTEGYLLLALGEKYIYNSLDLIQTLRINNDHRSVDIVVLPEHQQLASNLNVFNRVILFDVRLDPLFKLCNTNFERFCLVPRLRFNKFLQYKYTMVLDVDILCAYKTNEVWNFLKTKKQGVCMIGSTNNIYWHWGHWNDICVSNNMLPYETHGGLFFFNSDYKQTIDKTCEYAEFCFVNYDALGMKRLYQGGAVDEPCFSFAFNKTNQLPINFSEFPIMTFNLNASAELPTKILTEEFQKCIMSAPIPFIHMFEKNEGHNYKSLFNKIQKFNK